MKLARTIRFLFGTHTGYHLPIAGSVLEAVRLLELGERPATRLAAELGIRRNRLHKWQAQMRGKGLEQAFPGPGTKPLSELSELERLRRELKRVTEERDVLKKSRSVLCEVTAVRYGFIRDHRKRFPVARLCQVLAVSRSGFHAWLNRPASAHALADQRLLVDIRHLGALQMALAQRRPQPGLIHHTDRGPQYNTMKQNGVVLN